MNDDTYAVDVTGNGDTPDMEPHDLNSLLQSFMQFRVLYQQEQRKNVSLQDENSHMKDEIEKSGGKIKELEAKLQQMIDSSQRETDKGQKEVTGGQLPEVQTIYALDDSANSAADLTNSTNDDNEDNDSPADLSSDFYVPEIKREETDHVNGHDAASPIPELEQPVDIDVKVFSGMGGTSGHPLVRTFESSTQSKAVTKSRKHHKTHTSKHRSSKQQKTVAGESKLQVHYAIHSGQKPQISNDSNKPRGRKIKITARRRLSRQKSEITAGIETEETTCKCSKCGEVCTSASLLADHKSICSRKCDVCGKLFNRPRNMEEHKLIHNDVKRYKCSICSEAFKQSAGLSVHIQRHHKGGIVRSKPSTLHICEVCGKVSQTRADLKKHAKIHSGNRPYKCDVCQKAFTHMCSLTIHKRLHNGERPYKCEFCDKAFSHSSPLSTHRRVHTGEKPYECAVCLKSFSALITLKRHKQTHTNERLYKCDLCEKTFTAPNAVANHKRIHTGEKPYKCSMCPKAFAQASALFCHEQLHGDEKAYKCSMCDRAFKTSGYLNKHIRTHADKRPQNSLM